MNNAVISLAILKVNWDQLKHDYVEIFIPFIVFLIHRRKLKEIEIHQLCSMFVDEWGLSIPYYPMVTILNRAKKRGFIKKKPARDYAEGVGWEIKIKRIPTFGKARLKVLVKCYSPNKSPYDLVNLDKILMDTIQDSGLFKNDAQIDDIRYKRMFVKPPGFVQVIIQEI